MPEKMQKTRNEFNHPELRKRPKTVKELPKSKLDIFHQLGQKKMLGQKKNVKSKKNLGSEKNFGLKKLWIQNKFWV